MYREEIAKLQDWEEECTVEQREVPRPKPHPLLVAMGDITVGTNHTTYIFFIALSIHVVREVHTGDDEKD